MYDVGWGGGDDWGGCGCYDYWCFVLGGDWCGGYGGGGDVEVGDYVDFVIDY